MTTFWLGLGQAPSYVYRLIAFVALLFLSVAGSSAESTPSYVGPKRTVAVVGFEAAELMGGATTLEALDQILVEALLKDGRFVVTERLAFTQLQSEQQLGQAGIATPETAVRAGQMIGASILIRGSVTQFEPQAHGSGVRVGGDDLFRSGSGGSLGISSQTAIVKLSLRLIESSTGQILATSNGSGTASANGFRAEMYMRNGLELGGGHFQQTPLGKAAEEAIAQAVSRIVLGIETVPWSALIVDNSDGKILISAGSNQNLTIGTRLQVYRKGRDLTDPATGILLETEFDHIAAIQIDSVREKVSSAVVTSGGQPQRGDVVKLK